MCHIQLLVFWFLRKTNSKSQLTFGKFMNTYSPRQGLRRAAISSANQQSFWSHVPRYYQAVGSRKNAMSQYHLACVVSSSQVSNQGQMLARFKDNFASAVTCNLTSHLKSEILTPYLTSLGRLPNFAPFQIPPLGLFSHDNANKNRLEPSIGHG